MESIPPPPVAARVPLPTSLLPQGIICSLTTNARPSWVPVSWPPEHFPPRPALLPAFSAEVIEKPLTDTEVTLRGAPLEASTVSLTFKAIGIDYDSEDVLPIRVLLLAAMRKPQGLACHFSKMGMLEDAIMASISKLLWICPRAEQAYRSISISVGGVAHIEWVMSGPLACDKIKDGQRVSADGLLPDAKSTGLWITTNKDTRREVTTKLLSSQFMSRRVPHTVDILLDWKIQESPGNGLLCVWVDGKHCLPAWGDRLFRFQNLWGQTRIEWTGTCGTVLDLEMYEESNLEQYYGDLIEGGAIWEDCSSWEDSDDRDWEDWQWTDDDPSA